MAASEEAPVSEHRGNPGTGRQLIVPITAAVIVVILLWFFPLFHVVPLQAPAAGTPAAGVPAAFYAVSAASKIWLTELPAAARSAVEMSALAGPLRENAKTAKSKFAKSSGLGAAYFFVRGRGRVVTRERNHLRVALDGANAEIIAIHTGPVFGNTVRDGCGFLDVNAFPGLQEFNALSAELNALVEKNVLPALRERAQVGATIEFTGCAEAPETAPDTGEPLLLIVPVQAEVR